MWADWKKPESCLRRVAALELQEGSHSMAKVECRSEAPETVCWPGGLK